MDNPPSASQIARRWWVGLKLAPPVFGTPPHPGKVAMELEADATELIDDCNLT